LLLDGIYPQLEQLKPKELGKTLQCGFQNIDEKLKNKNFQRYHRLALAESVMEKEEGQFRASTYLEFSRNYANNAYFIHTNLQQAKEYIVSLKVR
jgi:hypothetical protein